MGRIVRSYTTEFKSEAVKMILERGRKVSEVSKELGINENTLYTWVGKFRNHGSEAFPGKGHLLPQDEKLRQLEKDLRDVTMERDILKKAMAVFSRHQR